MADQTEAEKIRRFLLPYSQMLLEDEETEDTDSDGAPIRYEMSIDDAFQTAYDAIKAIRAVVAWVDRGSIGQLA